MGNSLKILLILCTTVFTVVAVSYGQKNVNKGSKITISGNNPAYNDGRPSARYRLDAKDDGIVVKHGFAPDSCDYLGARDVWVFKNRGTFYLHYDGAGPKGWLTCLATSKDLINWELKGKVLDFGETGKEDSRSASYGTVYNDGLKWHMFYLGTPNVTAAPDFIPGFPYLTKKAESTSPTGPWIKRYDIVPFTTKPGTYYSTSASPGFIIKKNNEYRMLFSASTSDPIKRTLSYARTTNLDKPWTPDPQPFLPLTEQIENSSVYYQRSDNTWFLFTNHVGITNGLEYTDAIWVYWTKDLDSWNPENKAVVLDSANCSWSKHIIGLPSVIKKGNRLAIIYDGNDQKDMPLGAKSHMKRDIGLAWLALPIQLPGE
jgi:predicted GH43/DUF377 family glycosyl hydrolase